MQEPAGDDRQRSKTAVLKGKPRGVGGMTQKAGLSLGSEGCPPRETGNIDHASVRQLTQLGRLASRHPDLQLGRTAEPVDGATVMVYDSRRSTAIRSAQLGAVMAKRQELNSQLRFVSSKVACEVLGVTAQTLRRWAKKGQIGAIKTPGGQYRFDLSGLIVVPKRPEPAPTVRKTRKVEAQVDLEEAIAHAPVKPVEARPVIGPEALRAQVARLASASTW